jgi:hypothetical protein
MIVSNNEYGQMSRGAKRQRGESGVCPIASIEASIGVDRSFAGRTVAGALHASKRCFQNIRRVMAINRDIQP